MLDSEIQDSTITRFELVPFKYLFRFGRGLPITKENLVERGVPVINYGEIHSRCGTSTNVDKFKLPYVSDSFLSTNSNCLCNEGDVIFADTSEDIEGAGNFTQVVGGKSVFAGYHCVVARPTGLLFPKFVTHVLDSLFFRNQVRKMVKGVKVYSVTQSILGSTVIPIPPHEEQRQIAAYLNRETAKIDKLIAKQQKLIKLLEEKRQAVISEVVTKGLNPNVKMKDSRIEWLGEIPNHWCELRLKNVITHVIDTEHKTIPFIEDGEFFVVRTSNIREGKLLLDECKRTDETSYIEWTRRGVPSTGDLILTREAPAGQACLLEEDFPICLGQRTVLIKVGNLLKAKYLLYSIYSDLTVDFINQVSVGSTVQHLNMADIPNIPIFLPPLEEQVNIIDFLDRKLTEFEKLKNKAADMAEYLIEHRQALITAAVTGKIDVRGLVTDEEVAALGVEAVVEDEANNSEMDVPEDSDLAESLDL